MKNYSSKETVLEIVQHETVGAYISFDEFQSYTQLFKELFPNEISQINISRKAQEFILSQDENKVSGIRFMFGLENQNDQNSFRLFLVPCEYSSLKEDRHNNIFLPEGYLDHNAKSISFFQMFELTCNYSIRFWKKDSANIWNKVTRGIFFSLNILKELIFKTSDQELVFFMGAKHDNGQVGNCVLSVINSMETIFVDHGEICPSHCNDGSSCVMTHSLSALDPNLEDSALNFFREFRDNQLFSKNPELVEIYYHTSPMIVNRIQQSITPDNNYIIVKEKMIELENLIKVGDYDAIVKKINDFYKQIFEANLFG